MGKLILIAGLPGSGKTEHMKQLASESQYIMFDDFKNKAIDDNPRFNYSRHFKPLVDALERGETCVVSDIDLCERESQLEAENIVRQCVRGVSIEWRCFENNPEQCLKNIALRARSQARDFEKEKERVAYYSRRYHIPVGAKVMPVWRAA